MRWLYLINVTFLLTIAGLGWMARSPGPSPPLPPRVEHPRPTLPPTYSSGAQWFQRHKQYCNTLEIAVMLKRNAPPDDRDGTAYKAACHALAGQIDIADETLQSLPKAQREGAASIVFRICHPIADAGDDRSAGPMMRLVLNYQPMNFMALYHAGMSEYALQEFDNSRRHLGQFLEIYRRDDHWTRSAKKTLAAMEQ